MKTLLSTLFTLFFSMTCFADSFYLRNVKIIPNENYLPTRGMVSLSNNPEHFLIGRIYNDSGSSIGDGVLYLTFKDCDRNGENCDKIGNIQFNFYPYNSPPHGEARNFKFSIDSIPEVYGTLYYSYIFEYRTLEEKQRNEELVEALREMKKKSERGFWGKIFE